MDNIKLNKVCPDVSRNLPKFQSIKIILIINSFRFAGYCQGFANRVKHFRTFQDLNFIANCWFTSLAQI